MKKILLIIFIFVFNNHVNAQETIRNEQKNINDTVTQSSNDDQIFVGEELDKKAEFDKGVNHYYSLFMKKFNYPKSLRKAPSNIRLQLFMSFIIEKNGELSNITIERDPGYDVGSEAKRVLALLPPWKPAEKNGKPVRTKLNMPFTINVE